MYLRKKTIKNNEYFYLEESYRAEGEPKPKKRTVAYLGATKVEAIAKVRELDVPNIEKFVKRIEASVAPQKGINQGKRGRPKKTKG